MEVSGSDFYSYIYLIQLKMHIEAVSRKTHDNLQFRTDRVVVGQKTWIDNLTLFQRPMMKFTSLAPFVGSSTKWPRIIIFSDRDSPPVSISYIKPLNLAI